jgi:hypothetical protein
MYAHGQPLNLRALLQQHRQRVAAICRVRLLRQPFDAVIRMRAVGPLVSMRPESQLEVQPARGGLRGNEFQRLQVHLPFAIAELNRRGQHSSVRSSQLHHAHAVPRNVDQIWIGKVQVIARYAPGKVVLKPEREAKPVESARYQQIQIPQPEILVVEPRFVLNFTAKIAPDAPHFIGRPLQNWLRQAQRGSRVRGKPHSLRHLEQTVNVAAHIAARNKCRRHSGELSRRQSKRLLTGTPRREMRSVRRRSRSS